MINRIIDACARNRFLVFTGVFLLVVAGIWSLSHIALDALPDISDVEVIVHTRWAGEPPTVIEDQVTYPLVTTFLSAPHVKAVRAQTMFGDSYVFVVFSSGTDLYWARSRVLEYLQQIQGKLPAGVHPAIGPDATGAGWVYEYALVDHQHNLSLASLRSLQDWFLRYQLETVPGVAEVATIGGWRREFQVNLDPDKLRAYNIPLARVIRRVRASANEVGGRVLELNGVRYLIRGQGYLRSLRDLRNTPVGAANGTPVLVSDLGSVSYGPDLARGVADWNGEGQTVGGIVVMRFGENALRVIDGVKQKLAALKPSLPPGVEIKSGYDRSGLIRAGITTLRRDLLEEAAIVSLVIVIFLFHFRSALIPILALPIAVIATFIPMAELHVSANIMSLGGLALAIGVLVDAAIVMVENGYRRLADAQEAAGAMRAAKDAGTATPKPQINSAQVHAPTPAAADAGPLSPRRRRQILLEATHQVGPALFNSLLIIVLSFLPVFLLQAQEGRMFRPLAWTKTLAVGFASILAITLVPTLMLLLIRGRLRPEHKNPVSRFTQALYLPLLRWALRHRKTTIAVNLLFLAITVPLALGLGSQFMPSLYEGSALYMPTALPGISITTAGRLIQAQDRIIHGFPEVASVFGTAGRSNSATDNAPLDMVDTTIMLKPRGRWPHGETYAKLIAAMDAKLQFPGLTNTWTMPVENRLDMELTGLKTPVGLKLQGPNLTELDALGERISRLLSPLKSVASVFAERAAQGYYLNVQVHRALAARYGLTVGEVQQAVTSGIGGSDIATNIEGRKRFPINVRYNRDFRDDLPRLGQVLLATPAGAQIPLAEVASLRYSHGPTMIRDEGGALTSYVYVDLATANYGGFVAQAQRLLRAKLKPPPGYTWHWSGEYKFEQHARKRLELIVPLVFFLIFLLLYLTFHSIGEALLLLFPTFYALTGGLLLQYLLGYNFSVAVWVGYIALFGIAVETGVVMVVYLREALDEKLLEARQTGRRLEHEDINQAAIHGAVQRLRPKLMTVACVLASLAPIFWEAGIGSDVMKPIAAPIVGGMITSSLNVLILLPVLFAMLQDRALRRGQLKLSSEWKSE